MAAGAPVWQDEHMKITLKLFATLEQYLPAQRKAHNEADVEVPGGASIADVLARFGVPRDQVHLVLLNGRFIDADSIDDVQLAEGQALAVWPPVAGG